MGMDSRVVPTSGGRKALHENSSLEQVQALVKRFYGLNPTTTQQVSTCLNRCHKMSTETRRHRSQLHENVFPWSHPVCY
jgi:hypothetical protein